MPTHRSRYHTARFALVPSLRDALAVAVPPDRHPGKIPAQLLVEAHERGLDSSTKPAEIVAWLKDDYDLGRGHAMALVHVIRNGATISDKHVGTTGTHRDETDELRLDGIANR